MAVLVLGEHHGHPSVPGRADYRGDAPIMGMHDVELAVAEQPRDRSSEARVHDRHRMRPHGVGVEEGQSLRSCADTVDRESPIQHRPLWAVRGDRNDFDAMAAALQSKRQISNVLLDSADNWGIKLRHHENPHVNYPMPPAFVSANTCYLSLPCVVQNRKKLNAGVRADGAHRAATTHSPLLSTGRDADPSAAQLAEFTLSWLRRRLVVTFDGGSARAA
jgi:hypothetical protein